MRTRLRPTVLALATLTFVLAACSESTTAPEVEVELPPEVVLVRATEVAGFDDTQYKVTCRATLEGASACPVVRWNGVDYIGLSYRDNRFSMAIHAFDASGALLGAREYTGARYLADVLLDAAARTATLVGQEGQTITVSWDELQTLR